MGDTVKINGHRNSVGVGNTTLNIRVNVGNHNHVNAERIHFTDALQALDEIKKHAGEDKRVGVLNWAKQEFGTSMIKELNEEQLRRVVAYSKAVLRNQKRG